jgi:hypothetical protein
MPGGQSSPVMIALMWLIEKHSVLNTLLLLPAGNAANPMSLADKASLLIISQGHSRGCAKDPLNMHTHHPVPTIKPHLLFYAAWLPHFGVYLLDIC